MPIVGPMLKPCNRLELRASTHSEWHVDLDQALNTLDLSIVETLQLAIADFAVAPAMAEAVSALVERLPILQTLNVRIVGTTDPVEIDWILALRNRTQRNNLIFRADFLLGDDANAFTFFELDKASPTSLLAACRALRTAGAEVCWLIPTRPALTHCMEALFSLAQDEEFDAVLIPSGSFPEESKLSEPTFTSDERLFLLDFVSYRLLDEDRSLAPPNRISFYETLRDVLTGEGTPSHTDYQCTEVIVARAVSGSNWVLSFENALDIAAFDRPSTSAGIETYNNTSSPLAKVGEVVQLLFEGTRALGIWACAMVAGALRSHDVSARQENLPCVLIIGAYGGEHIGDAAILGGVLFRIHRQYGTTQAIVMSQRPHHTRHFLPMLDTPVGVTVEISDQSSALELMPKVDAVVYAGGPLMDLPKQLVRHLYAVSLAKRAGKPFIIEGIGVGPFVLWPSEWTARRIVRMAAQLSVRTSDDAKVRVVSDLSPDIGRDPAFDYLETRGQPLTRLADIDRKWIEQLVKDVEGRVIIGLNLRPIRHDYTVGVPAAQRIDHTRLAVTQFEQHMADGMRQFTETVEKSPCFVFFPMNPTQMGQSDLRSAYRIKRLLDSSVDFRIWQGDPGLDGVIALLRQMDAVISMRFHATIFALSQGCPAIGIDYRVGKRDKVGALLGDFGQSENCSRIDQMTSDWLCERLRSLVDENGTRHSTGKPLSHP